MMRAGEQRIHGASGHVAPMPTAAWAVYRLQAEEPHDAACQAQLFRSALRSGKKSGPGCGPGPDP